MLSNECSLIKKELETCYDIPFAVRYKAEYNDPVYTIMPENELCELFEINITIRQGIRVIVEIIPQRYSADMIRDMNAASKEKKALFREYLNLLDSDNTKVDIRINHHSQNLRNDITWEQQWKDFKVRISKVLPGEFDRIENIRVALKWAVLSVGMMMSLLNVETMETDEQYAEGKKRQVTTNRYERNPANRELCLAFNGYVCKICGFDFEKRYGEIGHNFIHVHHIEKVSSQGGEYFLNPKTDLIPVCPNCHAMLHRLDPPMNPDKLRKIIEKRNSEENIDETI